MKLSRRHFFPALGLMGFGGLMFCNDIKTSLVDKVLNLFENENPEYLQLVDKFRKSGFESAVFDRGLTRFDGSSLEGAFEKVIITKSNSYLMDSLYALCPSKSHKVKQNLDYIIFTPNAVKGNMPSDVNGKYVGDGIALVDTKADDGGIKNPVTYLAVLDHEAEHAVQEKSGAVHSVLSFERGAFESELDTLIVQYANGKSDIVSATIENVRKHIETANLLKLCGEDFNLVYPMETILSSDFLHADISKDVLKKYMQKSDMLVGLFNQNPGKARELMFGATIAYQVLNSLETNGRVKTIKKIVNIIESKTDPLLKVNAAMALNYLSPNACKIQSSANLSNGIHVSFGEDEKKEYVGGFVNLRESYSVSDLPSISEIVKDEIDYCANRSLLKHDGIRMYRIKRNEDFSDNLYDGKSSFELADVDKIMLRENSVLIPKKEGKPHPAFVRYGIEVKDDDGFMVFYGSRDMKHSRGFMVSKIDMYDSCGNFIRSGVAGTGSEIGVELDIDYKVFAKSLGNCK